MAVVEISDLYLMRSYPPGSAIELVSALSLDRPSYNYSYVGEILETNATES